MKHTNSSKINGHEVCNNKSFCYIVPVVKNKIVKIMYYVRVLLYQKHMMRVHLYRSHYSKKLDHEQKENIYAIYF